MEQGGATATELMPRLVVGYTELGGALRVRLVVVSILYQYLGGAQE